MTADRTSKAAGTGTTAPEASAPAEAQVAAALRQAYEEAVREEVPPEFLDLLGKLS